MLAPCIWKSMLDALAALYSLGYPIRWSGVYPTPGSCVSLPAYPWQKQRCWMEPGRALSRY